MKHAFFVLLLFFATRVFGGYLISWTPPTEDEAGILLPPGTPLVYRLYGRRAGEDVALIFQAQTAKSPFDISEAPAGCYELYVTAVIPAESGDLESQPSEMVTACINLACGEVGIDGSEGYCVDDGDIDDGGQLLAPGIPQNIKVEQTAW